VTRVALVDAGGANLASVRFALERLGASVALCRDPGGLEGATHVVLPGVGAAAPAMSRLRACGLDGALRQTRLPLIGICLGMQLLFESSAEGGDGLLGLLPGRVLALPRTPSLRTPHMGWNALHPLRASPLLAGVDDGSAVYFAHGFAAGVGADCIAASDHGGPFAAVVERDNACGVQFHPERSGSVGARLLANFLRMRGP